MQHLQSHVARLFNDSFSCPGYNSQASGAFRDNHITPGPDLKDEGDRCRLKIDIPGAYKSEVHVGIKGDQVLTDNATTREEKNEGKSGKFLHHERFAGSYQHTLILPEPVNPDTMPSGYEEAS